MNVVVLIHLMMVKVMVWHLRGRLMAALFIHVVRLSLALHEMFVVMRRIVPRVV